MVYQYAAYKEGGEMVRGKLEAANEEAATDLLSYAGYQVITLKPLEQFANMDKLFARFFRVKPAEMVVFYRQLALLLESGLDIVTSLELLRGQSSSRLLKKVLDGAIADLRAGNQLSAALSKYPQMFSPIHCKSLKVGEQTGSLEVMLRQVADYIEREVIATKGIKSALMYPIIAIMVTVVVVGMLVTFVLPAFAGLYSSLDAELPLPTRILIGTSEWMNKYGLFVMVGVFVGAGIASAYVKTPGGKYQLHKLLLKLPLIGRVTHLNELARYSRSISLLFRAGLPLPEIMPLVAQSSSNKVMAEALAGVHQDMLKGEGLSLPMGRNKLFLPMMVQMVKVGEETGRLDATLLSVAETYEVEAQDKTSRLIGLIQPIVTLIIGALIGFIALSMVSAMYSIYGQVV